MSENKCYCCGDTGVYNIKVCKSGDRLYLPNQHNRDETKFNNIVKLWFCKECMRKVEDNFRATIEYMRREYLK